MACANISGLNEITELSVLPIDSLVVMEAQSRQSRIPKFGFGFKKLVNGPNSSSNDKSKVSSSSSSPNVTRSKSMRVHRSQPHPLIKRDQHSIDNGDADHLPPPSHIPPPAASLHPPEIKTRQSTSKSNPNSRSNSPYGYRDESGGITDSTSSNDSLRVQVNHTEASSNIPTVRSHSRSYSFGSKDKHMINSRPNSATSRRSTVTSRSNKPSPSQGIKKVMTVTQIQKGPSPSLDQTDGNIESSLKNSTGGGRGKRPFSFHEGSPDLNQLATELSQMEEPSTANTTSNHHTSTRIPTQRPSLLQASSKRTSSSRLVPPIKRSSTDDLNRPSSAASNYKHNEARTVSRPRSAADVHKVSITQRQTSHGSSQASHGSRSSTPSSGRSTPMFKQTEAGIMEEDEEHDDIKKTRSYDPTPHRSIKGTRTNATSGIRFGRTPLISTANIEGGDSGGVGLNELEGAVLIDAEDYRRMVQEVKTLKTMLLRLKRELAADGMTTPPTSTPPTSMKSSVVRLKQGGGANNTELLNKIQKLTSERDKALQDIEVAKKKQKASQDQLDSLKNNLEASKKENTNLTSQLTKLESHREYLLEKLERLHADKHKVEDKLNTLEKSAMYERTVLEGVWPEEEEVGMLAYNDDMENGLYYDDEDATY